MSNKNDSFYYGWVTVAVSFFTLFLAVGTRVSFGVYYIAILGEFGWSRADTAGAFSLGMLMHAVFAPITGVFIDRFGPRKLFPFGGIILFFGLLAASRISNIWQLYLFFGVIIAIGINILSYSPHMSIIPKWFILRRGLASGLVLSGIGLGTFLVVPFNQLIIDSFGWRSAFLVFSGIILLVLVPVLVIFHRNSPSDVGQHPDGIVPQKSIGSDLHEKRDEDFSCINSTWSFKDAISTKTCWLMILAVSGDSFIINMLIVHQAVYIVDMGYTKLLAAVLVGLVGIIASGGGILVGFISDRVGSKKGYLMSSLLTFIGLVFLLFIKEPSTQWMLFAFAIFYGLGSGGKMPMFATIIGGFFPGNALGRILSIQSMGYGIGGALGSYLGGYFFDLQGTYFVSFIMLLIVTVVSASLVQMAFVSRSS